MRIILTGTTGFIGSHLIPQLLNDNEIKKVLLLLRNVDKLNREYFKNKKVEILEIDLLRVNIPRLPKYDVLIHLADIIPSKKDVTNFSDNIRIVENIINSIILKKVVKKVIYTSTLDVYGKIIYLPVDEVHPTNPLTFYGISKLANELLIIRASRNAKISCIILRLSQVYGPNEPLVKVIPLFIKKIKNSEEISLKNKGKIIRDWVYVKDVVSAIDNALYVNSQGIFNIATGKGYPLEELIKILGKLANNKPKITKDADSNELRPKIILSIEKAKKLLNYHPTYNLEKGLKDYLENL